MIIAIDFDGTIAYGNSLDIITPVPNAINVINKLKRIHYVYIWTVRSEGLGLESMMEFIEKHGLAIDGINYRPEQSSYSQSPKIDANLYIDDKALGCPIISIGNKKCVDWIKVEDYLYREGWF